MTDMLTSLIQSTPPQVRTARSPHARPDLARSDRTDGPSAGKTRASAQPAPDETSAPAPRDSSRKVADQPETILNTMPRGERVFRKVLQDRIKTVRDRKQADTDTAEVADKGKPEPRLELAGFLNAIADNVIESLVKDRVLISTQQQRARPDKPRAPLQVLPDRHAAKTAVKAATPHQKTTPPEKLAAAESLSTQRQPNTARQTLQAEPIAEKPFSPDKNTRNTVEKAVVARQAGQARAAGDQNAPALRAPAESRISAANRHPAALHSNGQPADNLRIAGPAQATTSNKAPASESPKKSGFADRMAAGTLDRKDRDDARTSVAKQTAPSNPEAQAEIAQSLKAVRQTTQVEAADRPQTAAQSSAASAPAAARQNAFIAPAESPAEQIIQSIRLNARGPQQEMDIRLHPSELGMVRMRFQHADGLVHGTLFVDRAQTRYEIEKELPQIIASLQQNGVQIQRVDVVLNQQPGQHNENSHNADFAQTDHGRFGQAHPDSEYSDAEKDFETPTASTSNHTTSDRTRENRITDEAISVYI